MIDDRIKYSIELLQKHEQTALNMNPDGYYLAFSGGKDSQVIYELCKMAGVKFKAHFSCTTVDPKEVLHFIKDKYPDVIWHRPEKSMFKLIAENKSLPLKHMRYCCRLIKEVAGVKSVVVMGVRSSESRNRAKRKEIEHVCLKGEDKIYLKPIFHWVNADIWNFLRDKIGYWCELYDLGFYRIGCLLCPMASPKTHQKDLKICPRIEYAYKKAIRKCMENGSYKQFKDENDVFEWWILGISMKKYFANKLQYKLYDETKVPASTDS